MATHLLTSFSFPCLKLFSNGNQTEQG